MTAKPSETPRTDALCDKHVLCRDGKSYPIAEYLELRGHARDIETELSAAQADKDRFETEATGHALTIGDLRAEIERLTKEIQRLTSTKPSKTCTGCLAALSAKNVISNVTRAESGILLAGKRKMQVKTRARASAAGIGKILTRCERRQDAH